MTAACRKTLQQMWQAAVSDLAQRLLGSACLCNEAVVTCSENIFCALQGLQLPLMVHACWVHLNHGWCAHPVDPGWTRHSACKPSRQDAMPSLQHGILLQGWRSCICSSQDQCQLLCTHTKHGCRMLGRAVSCWWIYIAGPYFGLWVTNGGSIRLAPPGPQQAVKAILRAATDVGPELIEAALQAV